SLVLPAGHDSLDGGAGSDTLLAGSTADSLSGGAGGNEFLATTGATLTDFNAAQGDFQPSQRVYSGATRTDIKIKLTINVNGSPIAIPMSAGNYGSGSNTSIAEVTGESGATATV